MEKRWRTKQFYYQFDKQIIGGKTWVGADKGYRDNIWPKVFQKLWFSPKFMMSIIVNIFNIFIIIIFIIFIILIVVLIYWIRSIKISRKRGCHFSLSSTTPLKVWNKTYFQENHLHNNYCYYKISILPILLNFQN